MNTRAQNQNRIAGFTLIELLVVIAIIAVLAGLMLPVMNRVSINRTKKVAFAELTQVQAAIEAYKAKYGFYPRDNTQSTIANPLYLELVGCTVVKTNYQGQDTYLYTTLDGSYQIYSNNLWAACRATGVANASASTRSTDEAAAAEGFVKELKPDQVRTNAGLRVMACSEGGNWNYNSSNPTNNPGRYDLWVDLIIGGKKNRISNWSQQAQIVP